MPQPAPRSLTNPSWNQKLIPRKIAVHECCTNYRSWLKRKWKERTSMVGMRNLSDCLCKTHRVHSQECFKIPEKGRFFRPWCVHCSPWISFFPPKGLHSISTWCCIYQTCCIISWQGLFIRARACYSRYNTKWKYATIILRVLTLCELQHFCSLSYNLL